MPRAPARARTRVRRPRAYHHGDLRRALVDGALAALAEGGVEALSLRDVARRAGVSPAAPYRHFADKDALLAEVAGECMERLGAEMAAAVAAAGDDELDRFRATGVAYVRFAWRNPAHFRVMSIPGVSARTPGALAQKGEAFMAEEARRLAAAQVAGKVSGLPLEQLMLAASCLMHGLANFVVSGGPGFEALTEARVTELALQVADVIGEGLLPRR